MTVQEMQSEILRLKKEKGVCILAHTYQSHDVVEIADFTGDSFQLSMKAKSDVRDKVLMCGVRFMAETVKILSPEKTVYLSNPIAGCPMAGAAYPRAGIKRKEKIPRLYDGRLRQYDGGAQGGERRLRHLLVRRGDRT